MENVNNNITQKIFYVELNGKLYKIEYQNTDEDIIIKRIDGENNFYSITKGIGEYQQVLTILSQKPLECNLIVILKRKIQNNEFASLEEYNAYMAKLNLTEDELKNLNDSLLPELEQVLGNKAVLYPDIYQLIFDELQKPRNEKEKFQCNFSVAYGDIGLKMLESKDGSIHEYDFHQSTTWQFTESFRQNFLNQLVVDFAQRDHHNEDDLLRDNHDDTFTLYLESKSNANLVISGITESYAKELRDLIKKTKVIGNDTDELSNDDPDEFIIDNTNEVTENDELVFDEESNTYITRDGEENDPRKLKGNARTRVLPGYNGNQSGNIKVKFLLIFAAEAIMAILLLTYLLLK